MVLSNKPTPGADADVWGQENNDALDELDAGIEADRVRLAELEALPRLHVGATPPTDTSLIWVDTSL